MLFLDKVAGPPDLRMGLGHRPRNAPLEHGLPGDGRRIAIAEGRQEWPIKTFQHRPGGPVGGETLGVLINRNAR